MRSLSLMVVYSSGASTLDPNDPNFPDTLLGQNTIYLYNVETGTNTRISTGPGESNADAGSAFPVVNGDCSEVAWMGWATNHVEGADEDGGFSDIYSRTILANKLQPIMRVSEGPNGEEANGDSKYPTISDKDRIAYQTNATTGLQDPMSPHYVADTNGVSDVYVNYPIYGNFMVSRSPQGDDTFGSSNGASVHPAICGNGECVTYATDSTDQDPNTYDGNDASDVVLVSSLRYFSYEAE